MNPFKFEKPKLEKPKIKEPKIEMEIKLPEMVSSQVVEEELILSPEELVEISPIAVEPPPTPEEMREAAETESRRIIHQKKFEELGTEYSQIEEETFESKESAFGICFGYTKEKKPSKGHEVNQDSCFFNAENGVFCVCDGVTTSKEGHRASRLVADAINKQFGDFELTFENKEQDELKVKETVKQTIDSVVDNLEGSSTTFSFVKVIRTPDNKMKMAAAWVGDSPIYVRKKNGEIKQLNQDDNFINLFRNNPDQIKEYTAGIVKRIFKKKILERFSQLEQEIAKAEVATAIKIVLNCETVKDVRSIKLQNEAERKMLIKIFQLLKNTIYKGIRKEKFPADYYSVDFFDIEEGDTVFVASDGLSDNITIEEMQTELTGDINDFEKVSQKITNSFDDQEKLMRREVKPDDLSVVGFVAKAA